MDLSGNNKTKIHKVRNIVIRLAIILLAYYFLYHQLLAKKELGSIFEIFKDQFSAASNYYLPLLVLLLMVLNWSVEALKWKFLIRKSENISFLTSLKAVSTGITVSTFTPNRIGEFLGRVFILEKTNAWKASFITILGSFSQLLVTIVLGSLGFVVFYHSFIQPLEPNSYFEIIIVFFILLADILLLLLFFNIQVIPVIFGKLFTKRWKKIAVYLNAISFYNRKELFVVLSYSFIRYLIFSLQYYFLFRFLGLELSPIEVFLIISSMFLLVSVIPSVFLSEIGVRGSVAIYLFGLFYGAATLPDTVNVAVFSAASLIWIVNLAVPALIGGIFVFQLKFFNKNRENK